MSKWARDFQRNAERAWEKWRDELHIVMKELVNDLADVYPSIRQIQEWKFKYGWIP